VIEDEQRLQEYPVEYLISVYYPNILEPELLAHPERGALNLHQAELPRYRRSNVFSHAIMNARPDDH
jgi:methionyl-tRNA formyltransferase